MRLSDELFLNQPTYGVLQTQDYLKAQGLKVNHKRIRRLLRKMGIMAIYPKKNLSKLGQTKYIYFTHYKFVKSIFTQRPKDAKIL
jgi:putative transposase